MDMNLYSFIGIGLLVISITACTVLKIKFRRQRKKLDGVHGFAHRDEPEKTKTDDWDDL